MAFEFHFYALHSPADIIEGNFQSIALFIVHGRLLLSRLHLFYRPFWEYHQLIQCDAFFAIEWYRMCPEMASVQSTKKRIWRFRMLFRLALCTALQRRYWKALRTTEAMAENGRICHSCRSKVYKCPASCGFDHVFVPRWQPFSDPKNLFMTRKCCTKGWRCVRPKNATAKRCEPLAPFYGGECSYYMSCLSIKRL